MNEALYIIWRVIFILFSRIYKSEGRFFIKRSKWTKKKKINRTGPPCIFPICIIYTHQHPRHTIHIYINIYREPCVYYTCVFFFFKERIKDDRFVVGCCCVLPRCSGGVLFVQKKLKNCYNTKWRARYVNRNRIRD